MIIREASFSQNLERNQKYKQKTSKFIFLQFLIKTEHEDKFPLIEDASQIELDRDGHVELGGIQV